MSASREKQKRKEEHELGISKEQFREEQLLKEKKRRKRSIITIVVILVVVISAFCVYTDTIPFFSGRLLKEGTALSVGETDFSAADFNYYYYNIVNEYISSYEEYFSYLGIETSDQFLDSEYSEGVTWRQYFKDYTIDELTELGSLLNAAAEDNFTLTQEQIDDLDSYFTSLSSYAAGLDMNIDDYYESQFGEGVTEEIYRRNMERSTLASSYSEHISEQLRESYTDEEIETYYNENSDDVDVVDYNYFFMSGIVSANDDSITSEEAMAQAYSDSENFVARLEDGESFYDLSYEYAREISKTRYEDESASHRRGMTKSSIIDDFSDWLFDSEREAGDITIVEGNPDNTYEGYFVVQFLDRYRAEYETVNYRNILVTVDVDDEETYNEENADDSSALSYDDYVEEQWAAGEAQVDEILEEWETEGGDEEAFGIVASTSSSDTNTYSNGGLNSQAYRYQTEDEIDSWLFDEPRTAGDYEVFEVSNGYQIIYFSGYDEVRWVSQVKNILASSDYDEWFAGLDYSVDEKFCMRYAMKD